MLDQVKAKPTTAMLSTMPTTVARAASDLELLGAWRDGDEAAGQALFERHFESVYRFFRNKCAGEADDLVQQTFFACVKSRDKFRADSSFRTYLFVIARNELYGFLRKKKRDGDRLNFGVTSLGEIVTTPGTKLAKGAAAEALRQALGQLPVEQQVLLELRYWHDLDATALGEVFEAPPATIRTRLRRARLALADKLGTDEGSLNEFRRLASSLEEE